MLVGREDGNGAAEASNGPRLSLFLPYLCGINTSLVGESPILSSPPPPALPLLPGRRSSRWRTLGSPSSNV